MTEIISDVLKLTFGLLVTDKARSKISERLNDGDVTHEEYRCLIVRELDDFKTKLDGLARRDLLSSLCFLQEGINGLYQSLQQIEASENYGPEPLEPTEQATLAGATCSEETLPVSQINDVVTLISAFKSLKIHSKERFELAKKSFELAREKATEAFCNEALSIEDRIQASQVRMMARILETSEDPDAGISVCLQYLKQLHDIKAIQEIFSVVIVGGMKFWFSKAKSKRLSIASSVDQMNLLLFEFARRFTNLRTVFFDWPRISFGEKTHHPLVRSCRLIKKYEKSGVKITLPHLDFTFPDFVGEPCCVVTSKKEIVAKMLREKSVQSLKPSGEFRAIFHPSKREDCEVVAMDIDDEDNLYVITAVLHFFQPCTTNKLLIFDEHGDKKFESELPFQSKHAYYVRMAVNNDKKIAVLEPGKQILRIGTSCRTNLFEVDNSSRLNELSGKLLSEIRFLDNNGTKIIVALYLKFCFYIYTGNGELERKVTIPEVKEYGGIHSVAVNYITKRILVKTGWDGIYLSSFSEIGELKDNVCLGYLSGNAELFHAKLTSNQKGAVALVYRKRVLFLQL